MDSDEDGISDYDETRDLNLDPNAPGIHNPFDAALADSTGGNGHIGRDWVPDGLNEWDGDGMLNGEEFMFGYNPIDRTSYGHCTASDTDGDGISDADEASTQWLIPNPFDPYFADATGNYPNSNTPDGIPDGLNDYDGDGQSNACECAYGSDPTDPTSMCTPVDSDGDGLSDIDEMLWGTDPQNPDSDGDGLSDNEEVQIGTCPLLWDTDGDGLNDNFELRTFSSGTAPFNPQVSDSTGSGCDMPLSQRDSSNLIADGADDYDCDGMTNAEEQQWGCDPTDASSFAVVPVAGPPALALLAGVLLLCAVRRTVRR